MAKVSRTTTVRVRRELVWAYLSDFGHIAEWVRSIDHSCLLTDQSSGVGVVRRVQQGPRVVTETIVEWSEPERLSYQIEGFPSLFRQVFNIWDLVDEMDLTRVTLTAEVVPVGLPVAALAWLAAWRIGGMNTRILDGLKSELERKDLG